MGHEIDFDKEKGFERVFKNTSEVQENVAKLDSGTS